MLAGCDNEWDRVATHVLRHLHSQLTNVSWSPGLTVHQEVAVTQLTVMQMVDWVGLEESEMVESKASFVRSASTTGRSSKSKSDGSGGSKQTRSKLPRPDAPSPPCPRCHAEGSNTKFCYYNNYNINQPRYYCKVCAC